MPPTRSAHPCDPELFVSAAEAAVQVRDRHQFFLWMQFHLQRFIPHQLVMCRLQRSPNADSVVHLFNNVPLPDAVLAHLAAPESGLWRSVLDAWPRQGRRALVMTLDPCGAAARPEESQLRAAGLDTLTVHGDDSRSPGQPEVVFVFFAAASTAAAAHCANLELWLPYLLLGAMRAFAGAPEGSQVALAARHPAAGRSVLTDREIQILLAVREAQQNAEIGVTLGISPATVKNHLRKIMRKLGARNRAHAVAQAFSRKLIT